MNEETKSSNGITRRNLVGMGFALTATSVLSQQGLGQVVNDR